MTFYKACNQLSAVKLQISLSVSRTHYFQLSSLALVFALHSYKPTPIYIMDEIDAALDFKNVSIVANYIKERTKVNPTSECHVNVSPFSKVHPFPFFCLDAQNAQFLIVSLRNFMFEVADRLVGIYKTNNCTKSVTINPQQFANPSQADDDETNEKNEEGEQMALETSDKEELDESGSGSEVESD